MKSIFLLTAFLFSPFLSKSQGAFERYGLSYDKDGELMHGRYIQELEEEGITKVFTYNKGLLEGDFMIYATNGNLIEKGKYHDGQKHGKWMNWTLNGIKTSEVKFNYGIRDGKWQIWDESGVLRYVMFYEVGEKVGTWLVYNENGELKQEKELTRTL